MTTAGQWITQKRVEKSLSEDEYAQLVLAERFMREGKPIPTELHPAVKEAFKKAKEKKRTNQDLYYEIAHNIRLWSLIDGKAKTPVADAIEAANKWYHRSNSNDIYYANNTYKQHKAFIEQGKRDAEKVFYQQGDDNWNREEDEL